MQFDLQPGVAATRHLDDFFDSGLFKEEVLDETILEIEVIERQISSAFDKAMLQVFATLLTAGVGVATGGVAAAGVGVGKILGAITGLGTSTISDSLKKAGDEAKQSIGQVR